MHFKKLIHWLSSEQQVCDGLVLAFNSVMHLQIAFKV